MAKFIFVTGGVVSSLGKGIISAGLAALLQARGYVTNVKKLDPYLNFDAGTISSIEHGEVFVTDDGIETDLDLGHYERFTGKSYSNVNTITAGKIYQKIIEKERRGEYNGATVQIIPHFTNEVKDFILRNNDGYDFVICEIGGTVGDIEVLPFIEGIRQLKNDLDKDDSIYMHLTLLPHLEVTGENKTKPTQHSVKELRSLGISPDIILVRTSNAIKDEEREKIASFCNINVSAVIEALDVKTVYDIPLSYSKAGLDKEVLAAFGITTVPQLRLEMWHNISYKIHNSKNTVNIGVIAQSNLRDRFKSINEAIVHGGIANDVKVEVEWIDPADIETVGIGRIGKINGMLMPGGFGIHGMNGKFDAVKFARENDIPFFGICFGLQFACMEALRSHSIEDASSEEFGAIGTSVFHSIGKLDSKYTHVPTSVENSRKMLRLGATKIYLSENSKASSIYGGGIISERHRHRFAFNREYLNHLEEAGLHVTGQSDNGFVEVVERKDHPWFVASQYHPELKSKPFDPHPLFKDFIRAVSSA